ncbi:MAG: GH36-type glycosyl hydrolase domain-containing protein [Cellulosilyticaceae bacterium]
MSFQQNVKKFTTSYHRLQNDQVLASEKEMPGKAYFIEDNNILAIPREDGDCRYPFGQNGFNYWVYASGYMHSNEGLFSPYLRASEGQEPKIAFFAGFKGKEKYNVVPILSVPMMDEQIKTERYSVFTKASAYYVTETEGVTFAIRTFVDEDKKMYFTLSAENTTAETKEFFVSSYFNPFLKNAVMEGAENRWFRQSGVVEKKEGQNLDNFLIEVYEERDRGAMAPNYGVFTRNLTLTEGATLVKAEETASRNDYVGGVRSSLHTPQALFNGTFGEDTKKLATFTEVSVAADMLHMELKPGASMRVDTVMTYCFEDEDMEVAIKEVPSPAYMDTVEEKMIAVETERQADMKGTFGKRLGGKIKEEVFNSFFEHLKKQVEFCSVIKGYIQLSSFSLIGIRDVFQAIEGLVFWEPEVARAKMLEGLNFIQPDGRCPRQYSLPRFEGDTPGMDLRPFIDQGVWVISTIATYLRFTQDFSFLEENCGYYDFVNEKAHIAKKLDKESSVLQHMFDIMDYLLTNRDHEFTKCVCALYGDWNDALDGLGVSKDKSKEYGTGVSVMATLQVYQNCKEMIELLTLLGKEKYQDKIDAYQVAMDEIADGLNKYAVIQNEVGDKRIVHGWGDERDYLVGGYCDPDNVARDGITSNAFWVLAGMYDADQSIKDTILGAYDRLGSKYGLKTFEPHFEKGTPGVGRIPNLPKGTAENGAAYIHASTFGVMSLFRMGETEKAWDELAKCLPLTHEKVSVSPYVMPNSYGFNEEKQIDGESMQDWQTGSSNVMLKTLIRFVFGIEPQFDGVWIQPSKDIPFEATTFEIKIRNAKVVLNYSNTNAGKRSFTINGNAQEGVFDSVMQLDKLWLSNDFISNNDSIVIEIID